MLTILAGYAFIFFARVIDVSLSTLRTLMIMRSKRLYAAVIGFVEVIVYVIALNKVVSGLSNPINLLAYALGFATGNYVGITIEEKLAIGLIMVQIITNNNNLSKDLRDRGFGVTTIEGQGKSGPRYVLLVSLKRKGLNQLMELIDELDKDAFIMVMDTKSIRGGYFRQTVQAK